MRSVHVQPRPQQPASLVQQRRRTMQQLLFRHRRTRSSELDHDQPFSWPRCLISVFSYILLLSDVIRTGLGTRTMDDYVHLEPDSMLFFGPYAYPVFHRDLTLADAAAASVNTEDSEIWAYKLDSTSVMMRAVATHLDLGAVWPPCVMYQSQCPLATMLSREDVFTMLDALVEAIAQHPTIESTTAGRGQGRLNLRVEYNWYDRAYHHALPWIFQRNNRRSGQALVYNADDLRDPRLAFCGTTKRARPLGCGAFWTHFSAVCPPTSSAYAVCHHVDHVWTHIRRRVDEFLVIHTNRSVELLILEGADDYSRGGVAFQGRKLFDVVTILRVRECEATACRTVVIDDYRYEASFLTTNVTSWYGIVSVVRVVGQAYAWTRIVLLFVGCYRARAAERRLRRASVWMKFAAGIRTTFLIPSQVVIYGSVFPIACYVVAHYLDSSAVYELVAQKFNSPLGQYHFEFFDVVRLCAVTMRSVWVAATVCHAILAVYTRRSWSHRRGVPGIPEFSISFIASLSIFAQMRALSWRNTDILEIREVIPSSLSNEIRRHTYDGSRGFLAQYLTGTTLDPQSLSCATLLLGTVMVVVWTLRKVAPTFITIRLVAFSRTLVPYSAGHVWWTNALVVSWYGTFVETVESDREKDHQFRRPLHPALQHVAFPRIGEPGRLPQRLRAASVTGLHIADTAQSEYFQREMLTLDKRSREVASMIYLINLAVMTDPLTLLRLRFFGGRLLGLYESRLTKRSYLLPYGLALSEADIPIAWGELQLLMVVNTKDLSWWDLLQCG